MSSGYIQSQGQPRLGNMFWITEVSSNGQSEANPFWNGTWKHISRTNPCYGEVEVYLEFLISSQKSLHTVSYICGGHFDNTGEKTYGILKLFMWRKDKSSLLLARKGILISS